MGKLLAQKNIFQGLNEDVDERVLGRGQYKLPALNIRVGSGGRLGVITNIKGTELVSYALPAGDNRCIGSKKDPVDDYGYYFIWNSEGYHLVLRYHIVNHTIDLVLQDNPDLKLLNFQRKNKITGVVAYRVDENNTLLYWCDDYNWYKKVNVQKAINAYLGTGTRYTLPLSRDVVDMIKYPPLHPPVCSVFNDAAFVNNYLKETTYQFRYNWVYDDYEQSSLGPISTLVYPADENNSVLLQMQTGGQTVTKIKVYGREGNIGDWFLIDTIDKEKDGIADNSVTSYTFRKDKIYISIDQNFAISPFSKLFIKGKCLELIEGDRLCPANGIEEYDNVDVLGTNVTVAITELPSISSQPVNKNLYQVLKNVRSDQWGVVYYDAGGRHGAVNTTTGLKFTYNTEYTNPGSGDVRIIVKAVAEVDKDLVPPEWAVRYSIVRTKNTVYAKYLQFAVKSAEYVNDAGTVVAFADATKLKLDFTNIATYSTDNNANLSYSFTEGDRIRLVQRYDYSFTPTDVDFKIVSEDAGIITVNKNPAYGTDQLIYPGDLWEIYTPRLDETQDIYYEVDAFYDILEPGTANRRHGGDTAQVVGASNAILNLNTFDCYVRVREMPYSGGKIKHYVQSASASDFFESEVSDIGRPNIESPDLRQVRRPTTIYYSEPYVADTTLNGLSYFYDTSFERYSDYGSVQRLFYHNKRLKVFQENKVGWIGVNERTLYDNAGQSLLAAADKVLNNIQYYSGEYGISKHPESFDIFGNHIYFTDFKRGVVCRLAENGIIPVSQYGMSDHFLKKRDSLLTAYTNGNLFIYGVYHRDYREYIVSFVDETTLDASANNETIAFNEDSNQWTTRYSFIPDCYLDAGTGIVSFKNGALYRHDASNTYNNFYGVQYSSQVTAVCNEFPSNDKSYNIVSLEGNAAWDVDITTYRGQESELKTFDFEQIGGKWTAGYLRDKNSPDGLLEGDDLQGVWLKQTLTNNDTTYVELFCVTTGFVNGDFLFR